MNLAFQATRFGYPRLAATTVRHAHLIGIAGSGMQALAEVMLAQGWRLSGSDVAETPAWLKSSGVRTFVGQHAEQVPTNADLAVYSDAVPADNPERRRAEQLGLRTLSYPAMLGELLASRTGAAIAGTHGKSTTTALAGAILSEGRLAPLIVGGAAPLGRHSGGLHGGGGLAVVEACEYRANFLHLRPQATVLLDIERDHFDCFASLAEVEEAFARLVRQTSRDGLVVAHAGCPAALRIARQEHPRVVTFGLSASADWRAEGLHATKGRHSFWLMHRRRRVAEIKLSIPGRHNVLNALAAAALAAEWGVEGKTISRALGKFRGLQRRLETLGSWRDVVLLDDYAHHPTEVAATLAAVRESHPGRRIWCIFQPHQASRTRFLLDEFASSLHNADHVAVAEIYRAREAPSDFVDVTAADLAARVRARGGQTLDVHDAGEIIEHVYENLLPGDVVLTMGAGDIRKVGDVFVERLRTYRAAG